MFEFLLLAIPAMVLPVEMNEPLHNPHKGWAIIDHAVEGDIDAADSIRFAKDGTPFEWYQNAAVLSTWAQVEPEPGRFDWTLMDRSLDAWAGLGKTLHLRFSTEDFGNIKGCPRWLKDLGVPIQTHGGQWFPDYNHPVYRDRLRAFLEVFAERFCTDARIETIDLRSYGNWGEWHSGYQYERVEDRVQALRGLIDAWRDVNRLRKPLMMSVSYEWEDWDCAGRPSMPLGSSIHAQYRPTYRDFMHRSAFDYALAFPDIGIRRDGCGGATFQEYDGRLMANFFAHWKKPVFTEFFGPLKAYRDATPTGFKGTKAGDDFIGNAVDEIISHHPNFSSPMGWKGEATAEFYNDYRREVIKGHKYMGYRFVLVRADFPERLAPGQAFTLAQTWENRAKGRCPRQYPLKLLLMKGGKIVWSQIDKEFDQRSFVSGESYRVFSNFAMPESLPPGEYEFRIAMVDQNGRPAIRLAVEGEDGAKRYSLGRVVVGEVTGRGDAVVEPTPLVREEGRLQFPTELEPNTQYLVSFRYRVERRCDKSLHTDDPGYFRCYAESGEHRRVGEARWFDKDTSTPSYKTVLIPTEGGRYTLVWDCVGGGAMDVDRVRVEKLPATGVVWPAMNSDAFRPMNGAERYLQFRVRARRDRSQVELPDDWCVFLRTNPEEVRLEPHTVYTVWFNCADRPQIWQGDYLFARVRGGSAEKECGFYRWTSRHTANPVRHAFSFRTGAGEGHRVEWGFKNGGECEISHIMLSKHGGD